MKLEQSCVLVLLVVICCHVVTSRGGTIRRNTSNRERFHSILKAIINHFRLTEAYIIVDEFGDEEEIRNIIKRNCFGLGVYANVHVVTQGGEKLYIDSFTPDRTLVLFLTDFIKAVEVIKSIDSELLKCKSAVWLTKTSSVTEVYDAISTVGKIPVTKLLVVDTISYRIYSAWWSYIYGTMVLSLFSQDYRRDFRYWHFQHPAEICCQNLSGVKIKVVTIDAPPLTYIVNGPNGSRLGGLMGDIFDSVTSSLNIQYEVYTSPDNFYGSKLENGEWTGTIKELIDKKADIAVAALTMTQERNEVIDFLPGVAQSALAIMYRMPKSTYIQPMSFIAWFMYALVATIILLLSWIFFEVRKRIIRTSKNQNSVTPTNVMAALFQQSSNLSNTSIAEMILLFTTFCYGFCISNLYASELVSVNLSSKDKFQLCSVKDLLDSTMYLPLVANGTSWIFMLQESNNEDLKRLWKKMKDRLPETISANNVEGIKQVSKGQVAYMEDSLIVQYTVNNNPELSLSIVDEKLFPSSINFALQKNSYLKRIFTKLLLRMQETGLINRIHRKYLSNKELVSAKQFSPVTTNAVVIAYVFLISGFMLAIIVHLSAQIFKYHKQRNR